MNQLARMAERALALQRRTKENPLAYFRPTIPQRAFLWDNSPIRLLLGGNQTGKTSAACALLLYHSLNCHPDPRYQADPPPTENWLITYSHDQSRTVQEKLWELIPKSQLDPSVEFIRGRGFRGVSPLVKFKNGSIIRIKTCKQGLGLASATCSLVVIDEPVEAQVFNELLARTVRGGKGQRSGQIAVTMTPIGADVDYLRQMVASGQVSCTRAPLTVAMTTPEGCQPLLSQAQIDNIASHYLPIDRDARLTGSWDVGISEGRIFSNFEDSMISAAPVPAGSDLRFWIGIDHGSQPNSQVAILGCCDMRGKDPIIYVLDEYISSTAAPPEAHARAILEMLRRQQIDPAICTWTGDSAHYGSGNRQVKKMSNLILIRAFEKILGSPARGLPWTIRTTQKYRHSVYFGASVLHATMARKQFFVHPRCQRLIMSIQRWTLKDTQSARSKDPYGHAIDGLRYGVLPLISYRHSIPAKIRVV